MTSTPNHDSDEHAYTYEVLNGPTYSESNRPPIWSNESPLVVSEGKEWQPPNMMLLPIADFPLIEDFEVRLEDMKRAGKSISGLQIWAYSATRGYMARMGGAAERLLIRDDFQIPLGDFQHPSMDMSQGWDITIAAKDNFVYILEGEFEYAAEYHAWFKVEKVCYLSEWQKAITLCRETFKS